MINPTVQHGTITEVTRTGSVTVQCNSTLEDIYMLLSDFVSAPRIGQRVVLETAFGHTRAAL
jgi:hypothetical protein